MAQNTHHPYYMFVREKNKIIISVFLFLICCTEKQSTTNFKDVFVYTSMSDREIVEEVLSNQLFDFKYFTPIPQRKYKPIMMDLSDFLNQMNHSAIMVISLNDSEDSLGTKLTNQLRGSSKENILLVNDYSSEDQLLFLVQSEDSDDLSFDLEMNKDWILSKLKENEFTKLKEYSFRTGINDSISQLCKDYFDLDISIQKDYQIIKESDKDRYLWIGRGYPYRWMLLYEDIQNYYNHMPLDTQRHIHRCILAGYFFGQI